MRERLVKSWEAIGTICSNFDHAIDTKVLKKLDKGKCYAQYPAWNFMGYVWKHAKGYSCEVWTYKEYNNTIHGLSLSDIMRDVSREFGCE